jgi:hypothetical protein
MVAAAMTSAAEAQLLLAGGRTTKGTAMPVPKVVLPPVSNFFAFQNPDNGMCKYQKFYGNKAFKFFFSACFQKTKAPLNPCRFGG